MLDAGSIIIIWIPMITSGWEKTTSFFQDSGPWFIGGYTCICF